MSENSAVRTQTQDEHAGLVRALSQEITNAIAAIEKNDLRQFQATIAKQETNLPRTCSAEVVALCRSCDRLRPVRDAYRALAQVNRVYTGVIKRSKRCADLLAALYGACGVGYGKDAALPGQQTLTCEV